LQARAGVLAVRINRPRQRLDGSGGVLFLDLEQAQAVVCFGEIGIDLSSPQVFVFRFS
jgi:hypothetical protein